MDSSAQQASLYPSLEALLDHLAAQRAVLRGAVDRVPLAMQERRPSSDRWSVAEVIEHLSIVERRVGMILSGFIASAPTALPADVPLLPFDLEAQTDALVDRSRRFPTRDTAEPSGKLDLQAAWSVLEHSRGELVDAIRRAEGLPLEAMVHPHPVLGPQNGYGWIAFIGGHEARHAAQIDEIVEELSVGPGRAT